MTISAGQTVLLTGASGGLGTYFTHALAEYKVKLALVAYPGAELETLAQRVKERGGQAVFLAADLRDPAQRRLAVDFVHKELGEIDILVNNAGVEFTSAYDDLTEQNIEDILRVNLEAPMVLTRLVLPEMLRRKRGHVVNVSSLAGKAGPAYQEPYAASKAGLVAFTSSLRATYRGSGVSASVLCPGFVEAGIYENLKNQTGFTAPTLLGTSKPEAVVRALIHAINSDLPEVIINPLPVRPLFAVTALFPRLGEFLTRQTGAHEFFKKVAAGLKAASNHQKR
jgi:short-subunit dehydrogenase